MKPKLLLYFTFILVGCGTPDNESTKTGDYLTEKNYKIAYNVL